MRRRRQPAESAAAVPDAAAADIAAHESSDLIVSTEPGGLVVQGSTIGIQRFADRLRDVVQTVDVAKAGATLTAVREGIEQVRAAIGDESKPMYFEFSPKSLELLKQHGAIPAADGFFRSLVHDGGQIAGNVDWKPVTPGPELMQLQTAAVGLALQASLKELADAVQRVEDKVDHLTDRIRAVQVGEIVAHHRVLDEFVDASDDGHPMSSTDWSSIDHLRTEIVRNIDGLRVLLRTSALHAGSGWSATSRASAAQKLLDVEFVETLALLAVSERNLAAWHRLRVERVERSEPEHLERTLGRVESDLALHRSEDQRLVDDLTQFLDRLAAPNGLEGLELWKRNQLERNTEALRTAIDQFAAMRVLDVDTAGRRELPTAWQSVLVAKDLGLDSAGRVRDWVTRRDRQPLGSRRQNLHRRHHRTRRP
jgi:hypothetical protein